VRSFGLSKQFAKQLLTLSHARFSQSDGLVVADGIADVAPSGAVDSGRPNRKD
jgi:hypothetical protein